MATTALQQAEGAAQTVINTSTDIAAGDFSGAPAANFVNNDATHPNAPFARAMIEMPDWAAAPVGNTVIELWGILHNTDGTEDDTNAPSGTSQGGARFFGSWTVAATDSLQRRTINISLEGIIGLIEIAFYIKNGTAQNMNNDAGTNCVVKITPYTMTYVS